jgi:hypothetical protein
VALISAFCYYVDQTRPIPPVKPRSKLRNPSTSKKEADTDESTTYTPSSSLVSFTSRESGEHPDLKVAHRPQPIPGVRAKTEKQPGQISTWTSDKGTTGHKNGVPFDTKGQHTKRGSTEPYAVRSLISNFENPQSFCPATTRIVDGVSREREK